MLSHSSYANLITLFKLIRTNRTLINVNFITIILCAMLFGNILLFVNLTCVTLVRNI